MKMWLFAGVLGYLICTNAVLAGSTDCSSADASVVFHHDWADGGAGRGPNERLVVNGEVLIQVSFTGGVNIHAGDIAFSKYSQWGQSQVDNNEGNVMTTLSVKQATISGRRFSQPLNVTVFCSDTNWIGPPRP